MKNLLVPEMEEQLSLIRAEGLESQQQGMVQLFDPAGRYNIICKVAFAEYWCSWNSDWKFEVLS